MTGAQPILTYTVLYTYVIFVMLHWYVIGLCGLVVMILDCKSRSPGFKSCQVKKYFYFSYVNLNNKFNFKTLL